MMYQYFILGICDKRDDYTEKSTSKFSEYPIFTFISTVYGILETH